MFAKLDSFLNFIYNSINLNEAILPLIKCDDFEAMEARQNKFLKPLLKEVMFCFGSMECLAVRRNILLAEV